MYNQVTAPSTTTAAAGTIEAAKAGRGPVVRAPRFPRRAMLRGLDDRQGRQRPWLQGLKEYRATGDYSL